MSRFAKTLLVLLAMVATVSMVATPAATAANLTIVNGDGAGEGFNDPTPVAALASNPGTTLGDQRLNVFNAAAEVWEDILDSDVEIRIAAAMNPLSCDAGSAVLGSAGTQTVHRDFSNAPMASTWYHQALANSLAGIDVSASDDIGATFNSDIDFNDGCLLGTDWWYGIGEPAPSGTIALFETVLHEIGHGIGVSTFVDSSTGSRLGGFDDVYMKNLEDHSLGLSWDAMTNGQRATSAVDTSDLHWTGSEVVNNRCFLSAGKSGGHVRMYAPSPLAPGSSVSHFDTALSPDELMEPFLTATSEQILTDALLIDEGWTLNQVFASGFEGGTACRWSLTVNP